LQLGPNDLAAVTFTDSGKRQNITSNRQRLQRAIDSLVPHPANSQPRMFSASRGASGSFTIPRGGSHCYLRGKYRGPAACVIDTFVTAGEALRQAPPGRKTLVYISAGPPLDLEMTDLRGESNPGEVVLGVQAALKALQEANVSVYAVDPSGVTPDGIMAPRLESLRLFGYDTGGRATLFTNTPWEAVPQIFRESSSYYMLGMRVSQTDEAGRFHRVQVSVNRPGVEVRARTGYYTPASERASAAARPTSPLDNAIGQVVPGGALPLALTLSPFAVPGERDAALAIVTALSEPLEQGPNTVELGVIALDADCGDCRNLPSERGRFTLAPSSSGSEHAEFLSRLELRPGSYEIRAAATLDGRSGGVFAHVDIPDYRKERLSASGLVLGASGSPSPARRDVLADLIPVIPTALREFRPDAEVEAFLRIYQGGSRTPGAVRVNATIRDAADRIVLDHTIFIEGAQFADSRSADYRLELPISMLDSGPHLLTVEAHLATGVVRRDAQFTVR
jgi:VWFA-related protein